MCKVFVTFQEILEKKISTMGFDLDLDLDGPLDLINTTTLSSGFYLKGCKCHPWREKELVEADKGLLYQFKKK